MSFERQSWPDLVGKDGDAAVEQIKKETGMIIDNHFLNLKFFIILFRFYRCSYVTSRFNGHQGLTYRSS